MCVLESELNVENSIPDPSDRAACVHISSFSAASVIVLHKLAALTIRPYTHFTHSYTLWLLSLIVAFAGPGGVQQAKNRVIEKEDDEACIVQPSLKADMKWNHSLFVCACSCVSAHTQKSGILGRIFFCFCSSFVKLFVSAVLPSNHVFLGSPTVWPCFCFCLPYPYCLLSVYCQQSCHLPESITR